MLFVSVSVPRRDVSAAVMAFDPAVAADLGYSVKSWLAINPGLALRPWCVMQVDKAYVRIAGWRDTAPQAPTENSAIHVTAMEFFAPRDERLSFNVRFVPYRRVKSRWFDPAALFAEETAKLEAYKRWLDERLVDVMPFVADIQSEIVGRDQVRVVRKGVSKGGIKVARSQEIPVAVGTITFKVKDPDGTLDWIKRGIGKQRAFGYGAMLPAFSEGAA